MVLYFFPGMRIVYDVPGHVPGLRAVSVVRGGRSSEPVLVVRLAEDGPSGNGESAGRPAEAGFPAINSERVRARDAAVRAHEAAHLSTLGPYAASAVLYDTVATPDGPAAVGGRIAVDLAEVPGDPEATLRKARVILAAAGAPGDPSAADARVAAEAYRLMAKAVAELSVDERA